MSQTLFNVFPPLDVKNLEVVLLRQVVTLVPVAKHPDLILLSSIHHLLILMMSALGVHDTNVSMAMSVLVKVLEVLVIQKAVAINLVPFH